MCSLGCLRPFCIVLGVLWTAAWLAGIVATMFLIFGEPLRIHSHHTYEPSWEDIGPSLIVCVLSLLANVLLIGGAHQHSRSMVMPWIVWNILAIIIFWMWFGYSQLKHYGYVDWTRHGMRGCYFCGLRPEESYVGSGAAIISFLLILSFIPVVAMYVRLRRWHRAQEPEHFFDPTASVSSGYSYRNKQTVQYRR